MRGTWTTIDVDGSAMETYVATPDGPGCLVWPVQLVLDGEENVYVSEEGSNRISVFHRDGEFVGRWGERGSADGQLDFD